MNKFNYANFFKPIIYIFQDKRTELVSIPDPEGEQKIGYFGLILNKLLSANKVQEIKNVRLQKIEPMVNNSKIAILGTVGIPCSYGGFETVAENLVHYHFDKNHCSKLTVWCSKKNRADCPHSFKSANLRYVDLHANGYQSILYDMVSLWQAIRTGHDRILLLGVSGALMLPLVRVFSRARIFTNIGGIEWKRRKWGKLARVVLRASEWAAVRFSHELISDNQGISKYIHKTYGIDCNLITYGGDHAVNPNIHSDNIHNEVYPNLPERFALALCRIEPENNIHIILEAFEGCDLPLVFVGNWDSSVYGKELRIRYGNYSNLYLLDSIYEATILFALRNRASIYIHGHSVGGTNPSLVEMMHFGIPVLAYDCEFNHYSTESKALYFDSSAKLVELLNNLDANKISLTGNDMLKIAQRQYIWDEIGKSYFELINQIQVDTKVYTFEDKQSLEMLPKICIKK